MSSVEPLIKFELERLLPLPEDHRADWGDVLRRADIAGARRSWVVRLAHPRRVLIATAALVVLGAGSAVAAVAITSRDESPVQFAPTTGSTPSLGSDSASIIASVEARVPDVLSIRITKDAISNASGRGTKDYLVAHIDIAASADSGPKVARASWESDLIGGALFTGFTQADLAPPFGVDLTLVLPDGTRDQVGGGLGKVVPNQVFDSVTPEIQTRIEQNAAAQGLTNVRVTTFQVVNDVIEIHAATTAAPATAASNFYKAGGIDGLLGQSENDFEGVYFQLDNAQGNPILIETTAPRAGAGGYWAAPSTGIQGDQIRVPHH